MVLQVDTSPDLLCVRMEMLAPSGSLAAGIEAEKPVLSSAGDLKPLAMSGRSDNWAGNSVL